MIVRLIRNRKVVPLIMSESIAAEDQEKILHAYCRLVSVSSGEYRQKSDTSNDFKHKNLNRFR